LAHSRQETDAKDTPVLNSGGDAAQALPDAIDNQEAAAQPLLQKPIADGLVSYNCELHKAQNIVLKKNGKHDSHIYAEVFVPPNAEAESCCQALFRGDPAPTDITDMTVEEYYIRQNV
jgi:hypothetical protein